MKVGLFTVVKSGISAPVISIFSNARPSTELIVTSNTGIDAFLDPFTVRMFLLAWRWGDSLNCRTASIEMKFLPEPVSRYAQNVLPLILSGTIAGKDFSSEDGEYPFNIALWFSRLLFS
jgi:hypothetical protein